MRRGEDDLAPSIGTASSAKGPLSGSRTSECMTLKQGLV